MGTKHLESASDCSVSVRCTSKKGSCYAACCPTANMTLHSSSSSSVKTCSKLLTQNEHLLLFFPSCPSDSILSERRPQRGIDAPTPAGGESGGDAGGPSPPFPERLVGFSELLKRAERAQAEVTEGECILLFNAVFCFWVCFFSCVDIDFDHYYYFPA